MNFSSLEFIGKRGGKEGWAFPRLLPISWLFLRTAAAVVFAPVHSCHGMHY
jgi:hypothetical protein